MDIKLFKFSKKPNSTKRPATPAGTNFSCELIENTSIVSPSVRLKSISNIVGVVTETVTNQAIVSFNDGVATNFNDIVCQINAVQTGSGVPSPSNVRPISGFSSVVITRDQGTGTTPTTWSVSLGQTVYGGSLDVTSGVLVLNQLKIVLDGTQEIQTANWRADENGVGWYYPYALTNNRIPLNTEVPTDLLCEELPTISYNNAYNRIVGVALSRNDTLGLCIWQSDPTLNTKAKINEYLAEHPITVVYPLATPITIQITPMDIPQNEGVNNLWCNTGNILSCTYTKYKKIPGNMHDFNYAYIPSFNRYYFIQDIVWELGTWRFNMTCDVLATYKTEIGASTHYVLRASSAYDGRIIDTAYPTKVKQTTKEVYSNYTLFGNYYTDTMTCYYIVGIIGAINPADLSDATDVYNGSVVYFCLTKSQMYELIFSLLDNVDLYNIDSAEMSKQLQKQLINPIQYIHSIKCVPVTPNLVKDGSLNNIVATGFYAGFQFVPITSYTPTPPTP